MSQKKKRQKRQPEFPEELEQGELFELHPPPLTYQSSLGGMEAQIGGSCLIQSRSDLISVFLQLLYTVYDSGGISAGRSLESVLLESARELFRSHVGYQHFEWFEDYFSLAKVNTTEPKQDWLFPWVELGDLLDDQVAYLLISEIVLLYEEMETVEQYSTGLLQNRVTKTVVALFPLSKLVRPSREALVREGRERVNKLSRKRMQEQEWYHLGVEWPAWARAR